MTTPKSEARKYLRYQLDEGGLAEIDLMDENNLIQTTLPSLIINSSFQGNELLIVTKSIPKPHQKIQVKFSELGAFLAHIVWIKELAKDIYTLGVKYEDPPL